MFTLNIDNKQGQYQNITTKETHGASATITPNTGKESMTFEDRILEKLKKADEMDARMRVTPTGVSPHPPERPWLKEVQKRNPYYEEIFLGEKK